MEGFPFIPVYSLIYISNGFMGYFIQSLIPMTAVYCDVYLQACFEFFGSHCSTSLETALEQSPCSGMAGLGSPLA